MVGVSPRDVGTQMWERQVSSLAPVLTSLTVNVCILKGVGQLYLPMCLMLIGSERTVVNLYAITSSALTDSLTIFFVFKRYFQQFEKVID